MSRQLEDAEDAHEPDHTQDGQAHGLVGGLVLRGHRRTRQIQRILLFGHHGGESDEIRDDSDDVDYIHHVSKEVELVGTSQESDYQLERKPYDAESLDKKKRVSNVRDLVFFNLSAVCSGIKHFVVLKLR